MIINLLLVLSCTICTLMAYYGIKEQDISMVGKVATFAVSLVIGIPMGILAVIAWWVVVLLLVGVVGTLIISYTIHNFHK